MKQILKKTKPRDFYFTNIQNKISENKCRVRYVITCNEDIAGYWFDSFVSFVQLSSK